MGPAWRVILVGLFAVAARGDGRLPLALLGDRSLSSGRTMAEVPLLLVPSGDIALFSNVHISSVSRSQPLVTCSLDKYSLDATPAVRVVLRRPVLVDSPEAALQFPSRISVLHEGLRMSVPVGALLAPVTGPGPYLVRVMYAVPTSPLSLHYPYYAPLHYPLRFGYGEFNSYTPLVHHPLVHHHAPVLTSSYPVHENPQISQVHPTLKPHIEHSSPALASHHLPLDNNHLIPGNRKPVKEGQLVTVLHFPEEIASPGSLYYQPESEDELGNRNPPEAVVPAGIVQSAQPKPNLQLFVNSKESLLLQALRDEAEENKKVFKTASPNAITVEAL